MISASDMTYDGATDRASLAQMMEDQGKRAAGNSSASVMGRTYPGAGGTIGPALTFGFLAAECAAREQAQQSSQEAAE